MGHVAILERTGFLDRRPLEIVVSSGFHRAVPGLIQDANAKLGIFEYTRQRAQELDPQLDPRRIKPEWARGSMEWVPEQSKTS
jgi:hypothetical protein